MAQNVPHTPRNDGEEPPMHTDYQQLRSAYQQLNTAIEQAPQLFADPTPYTLPASSLPSAQSFAAQLRTLVEHPLGAQTIMNWHFTETACLARVLGNLCGAVQDPNLNTSHGVAATYRQLAAQHHHPANPRAGAVSGDEAGQSSGAATSAESGAGANQPAGALTLPPLCDEPTGRNIPTLASHFAELDDADIAATATTWRNTAAALHDYAARLHQAATSIAHAGTHAGTNAITNADIYGGTRADTYSGTHSVTPGSTHIDAHGAETFATSQGIHEWADGLEEFARRSETIAQRIDSFAATYTTTRTQLADIATRREEALEQPAFQTYTFPEVAFTSRADQLLRGTYNSGIQQVTLAGISFPLPQAALHKVKPGTATTATTATQPGFPPQPAQQRGHSTTAPHLHDYGYNPTAAPTVTPTTWPTPRKQSGDPYSPDLHNPTYDPKIREAYQKLFSENRALDPLATDGRNHAFRRRNPEDSPTFRRREPRSNRILPKPGGIRGPIRHPDDPLYGTGR
ncbi:MAG: hypothetical protein KH384_08780 [Corynebacteriales bacterium]|nr:hypothetical protein [Mycobacteriales bacterium]